MGVGGEHGETVGRRDEPAAPDDEITIAIAIRGGAKVGPVRAHREVEEMLCVNEVRVRMMAAEVGQRRRVEDRTWRGAKELLKDALRIGAGHRGHGVEAKAKAGFEQAGDAIEIEQSLHQLRVIGDGIDDLDRPASELQRAEAVEIDIGGVEDAIVRDGLAAGENRLGDFLGGRPAIAGVVFDAEIAVRAARIVAGAENDAAERAEFPNEVRGGGRRQYAAASDQNAAETIGERHFDDDLDRFAIEEAPVAADHESLAFKAFEAIEDRLHEIFEIALGLEHGRLFAQPRGSGSLALEGRRRDCFDHAFICSRN